MPHSDRRLLLSIHDVGPRFERDVDQLVAQLARLSGGLNFAMLVVPDHWDQAPLSEAPAFRARLRGWAEQGVEMFVHGWRHRDDSGQRGFKATHMTAGEGEFLALQRHEALCRMNQGRTLIEDAIGQPVAGFIAPAWLYGPGALAALGDAGFRLAEDHMRIWRPDTGGTLARGPVITWASRSPARIASSLAFAAAARTALHALPTIRIGVHPGDTGVPAILASIDRTVSSFARRRTAGRYADLLAA
ncbi:MAG TPA: polysaccharide deacetylase family protein [Sphingomonas sp.]|nr:polysaccharide deacetylase family protein [Sphingomonas sp.]